jgi:hypothetical protein
MTHVASTAVSADDACLRGDPAGLAVSRVGSSRFGTRVFAILQGVTGVVLIALGVRLAFEQQ